MYKASEIESLPRSLRHMHWLCRAPSLLRHERVFDLTAALPQDYRQRIDRLAQCPDLLQQLNTAAELRLGLYFEQLYACLMTRVLGWELLGHNLQVREQGHTLGELDFLLRNPVSGEVEHHEIAVKFYLAAGADDPYWYGPNSRDRLDLKTERLLGHQVKMAEQPATRTMLAEQGLPQPARSRLLMPGYLFYPAGQSALPLPPNVSENHLRGDWLRASQVSELRLETSVQLNKPDWLGPWHQTCRPDGALALEQAARIAAGGPPKLFAQLGQDGNSGVWRETKRFFLVPDGWPYTSMEKA
ncbi:DUF1853 family protein [Marinobacterium sp. MBR-109]|uniref:DUF1853 family protein n=1 Tax=Marinobacterium sp. MBR-109 TaxID=3156462 RepID=UPI003396FE23